jgi:hypothetical protein
MSMTLRSLTVAGAAAALRLGGRAPLSRFTAIRKEWAAPENGQSIASEGGGWKTEDTHWNLFIVKLAPV